MIPDSTAPADLLSSKLDADVFFLSGLITRDRSAQIEKLVCARKRKDTILLVLVTQGGDPDGAFRIARVFQNSYKTVLCFIPGWCKSAGTLITLAASTIYIGDLGELGPLDIQVPKQDELDEAASGLLIDSTMRTLETTAARMFINLLRSIRRDTGVTTRMASELSAKMVVGLMGPIFGQVEPMRIGENARAMNITRAYGMRLNSVSKTLPDVQTLDFLVSAYPDHGFVIDRKEAKAIYRDVKEPTAEMSGLVDVLGPKAFYPPRKGEEEGSEYLSTERPGPAVKEAVGVPPNVQNTRKAGRTNKGRGAGNSRFTRAGVTRSARGSNGDARST